MLKKGNPEILLQDHAVVDSGCSSHMTGNKSYLFDYEDYNEGFVAFGSDPKGGSSGKDKEPTQEYILLPLHPHRTRILVEDVAPAAHENPSESSPKLNDVHDSEDVADKEGQHHMTEDEQRNIASQKRATPATSTNKLSTVRSSVSTATMPYVCTVSTPSDANAGESSFVYLGGKIPIDASTLPNADLPIDPNMPDLEDASDAFSNDGIFNGAYDDENVGAVADFNNMDDTINVSPIPTLRIHKDHPKDQILGDPKSAVQTRGKIQKDSSAQQALVSYISKQNRTNHKDHQNCLLACFLSQEEPKNISQALQDESWVEAMQEELLQFKLHMYVNHQDLKIQTFLIEYTRFQRGKIDKTLFIKSHKGDILLVQVYVDDIIFGLTKKELCNTFEKFTEVKTVSTPMETQKPLLKDEDGEEVDVHMYRSMIDSLMYLTSSRPDIMYLKGQPKLGLWYPKDSPFDLVAYTDSDYARASLDRKSTTGGCQFLGCRLISWQCKKQTMVANSTTKVEYVAASSCCGQAKIIDGEEQLHALVDGKKIIIIESTVRRDLQLEDEEVSMSKDYCME
ncbi:hypothetical protein Tco_0791334 [Tanacetum coccineum]